MSDPLTDSIRDAARLWVMRLADPAFGDWDGFTAWLEADDRHNAAYEAALEADAGIATWFAHEPPAPAIPAPRRRMAGGWRWAGGAIAASIAFAVGWDVLDRDRPSYAIETGPGEHRQIALDDGSQIDLNGGARIVLEDDTPRLATLERGEALFTIRHDESDPFVVTAGPARLVDVGTIFNVVRSAGATQVAVSEGAVIYNPDTEAVRLDPGKALDAVDASGAVRVSRTALESVGSWRQRRLIYVSADVADVAADLSRNLGVTVTIDATRALPFTGTLAIDGDPAVVIIRTAPLLGMTARRRGTGWYLTP